jgi:DNA primase
MRMLRPDALVLLSQLNPIAELAADYGLEPRLEGRHVVARCPFRTSCGHQLVLALRTGRLRCEGCGTFGNFVSIVVRLEGLSVMGALRRLAERAGVDFDEELLEGGDQAPPPTGRRMSTVPLWALTPPPFAH